jgi:hypothetical protein
LIELYNKILITLNKQVTSITFADTSKAFDTVWMNALLYKLEKNGINGELPPLFQDDIKILPEVN